MFWGVVRTVVDVTGVDTKATLCSTFHAVDQDLAAYFWGTNQAFTPHISWRFEASTASRARAEG